MEDNKKSSAENESDSPCTNNVRGVGGRPESSAVVPGVLPECGDLVETLGRIVDNDERIKTDVSRRELLKAFKSIVAGDSGRCKSGLSEEDVADVRDEIDRILCEAQFVVRTLLNATVAEEHKDFAEGAKRNVRGVEEFDENKNVGGCGVYPILEAPEGFRSYHNNPVALERDVSWKCRRAPREPERGGYSERVHDNAALPEVDTCGRATPEETRSCENEITVGIYTGGDVKRSEKIDDEEQQQRHACDGGGGGGGVAVAAARDDDNDHNMQNAKQHVGLATPTSDTSQKVAGGEETLITPPWNLVTREVAVGGESLRSNLDVDVVDDDKVDGGNSRGGRDATSMSDASERECAEKPTTAAAAAAAAASIETGVERCAQPPGCSSRDSTVPVSVAPDTRPFSPIQFNNNNNNKSATTTDDKCPEKTHLCWGFRNGRLVFDVAEDDAAAVGHENDQILLSKDLNKKTSDPRQLKLLGQKLKRAGITDTIDDDDCDLIPTDQDFGAPGLCEFDASNFDGDVYLVYDEVVYTSSSSDDDDDYYDDDDNEGHYRVIKRCTMRGDGGGDRKQSSHNPDRDNLKSLLKKPGRGKDGRRNRVVFNENKNEFFDADYIILIREECDYDEEDDDGVCTCNQHEMVRLTCCEPNCNCNVYDGYADATPQSPKFAPPLEFVDAVTLSPPEEYKDMELEEQQLFALQQMARRGQRPAVCRECSASHEDEGDGSQSDNEEGAELTSDRDEPDEKEKTDQSQQTTPTTPPAESDSSPNSQRYILETITMTTVSERRMMREIEDDAKASSVSPTPGAPPGGSPISGILKGGRLWKQASAEINNAKTSEPQQTIDSSVTSDEESGSKRSVRFIESEENKREGCDGAPEKAPEEEGTKGAETTTPDKKRPDACNNSVSPESTEMMLTFKLGNHVLISNNSLKPNSAVRQLFPCTKPLTGKPEDDESVHQYLVTAESLKAFEEAKRAKLPQIIQSGETDESIRRAIERNTLRRSLIRYEPRSKKNVQKTDNSLVERIKQLTCDVDDDVGGHEAEEISQRASPPGEEARNSPEVINNKNHDKSFSPSSSSTASSNSSSMSSTYKKITDLFAKREKAPDIQNVGGETPKASQGTIAPDLGNGAQEFVEPHCPVSKVNSTSEARKQFLSTLAPLTACVSGIGPADDYYYHMNNHGGDRTSVASSVGTEYSLEDIDEGLKNDEEETKRIAPDVLAGTPSASESGDELAMFVQQDAGRIERIKKKYQPEATEEDDEHDDYGFNRRPSVRGIKPRFGSTTEILQQIQSQMQPPNNTPPRNHVAWPYYSETNLSSGVDNAKPRNINQNVQTTYAYPSTPEEIKRAYVAHQYRPATLVDENIYQNCANQRCAQVNYRSNVNVYAAPVVKVGGGCSEYYQPLPRNRNARPHSPPPQEIKNYHQTLMYIPYNHIEAYQTMSPNPYYSSSSSSNDPCYSRVTSQNQINKRYIDPSSLSYQQQRPEEHYQKPVLRAAYAPTNNHLMATSRSESPLPGQFSTARATQTPVPNASTCNYYPPRYRPVVGIPPNGMMWQGDGAYAAAKMNRHSFPAGAPRYPPPPDSISLTDSESQHSGQIPNGYRLETCFGAQKDSMPNSPTKPRFIERGVPEGAASVSPQDTNAMSQSTGGTSPQQNPPPANAKPLFYAMNV